MLTLLLHVSLLALGLMAIASVWPFGKKPDAKPTAPTPAPQSPAPASAPRADLAAQRQAAAQEISQINDKALALAKSGSAPEAAAMLRETADRMARQFGEHSPQRAAVLAQLAMVYLKIDERRGALATMRQACNMKPDDEQSAKDQLMYLKNLGEICAYLGQAKEAEETHQRGLALRAAFYGKQHIGYAYGLEALAEHYFLSGRAKDALPLITEARDICMHSAVTSPLLADAIALRVYVALAAGADEAAAWQHIDACDQGLKAALFSAIIRIPQMYKQIDPRAVLEQLLQVAGKDPHHHVDLMTNAGALWLSAARTRKDADSWLRANAAMMEHAHRHHLDDIQLQLMLDLAMALECAGRNHEIAPAYEAALAQAYKSAGKARVASIHRNFAAYLRDDKPEEAHRHLKLALDQARQSGDDYELGSCLTALGIFVQHAGDLAAAKPLLQEALQRMRTDHEFYLYARNHMQAINDGGKCGCGNMQATIAQTLTDMVQSKLPPGLLEFIHLKDDGNLDIKLKRQPTPDEMQILNTVVRSAMAELRNASSKS